MTLRDNVKGRQSREFWVATEGTVSSKKAYSTSSKSMWYVPDEQATLTVDVHLFERRADANEKAHQYLDRLENIVRTKRVELIPRSTPIHY